ncbi:MAG: hypothetical protein EXR91_04100 [Gemmatimonadetes bacterium]|nr:hypothetical protein [Gemmatimonadota bacterium]
MGLFYLQSGAPIQLISVSVDTGATFAFRGREVVLEWPYFTSLGRTYDVSADGRRLLAVKTLDAAEGGAAPEITVVLNWFEEIRQRMGN